MLKEKNVLKDRMLVWRWSKKKTASLMVIELIVFFTEMSRIINILGFRTFFEIGQQRG